jgi:hypothetical protein
MRDFSPLMSDRTTYLCGRPPFGRQRELLAELSDPEGRPRATAMRPDLPLDLALS